MILIIFTIFSFLSIFISGISRDTTAQAILTSTIAVGIGILYIIRTKGKIIIPKYFYLMLSFCIILFLSLLFIDDRIKPLYYALTFEISIIYWLIFYNLEDSRKILSTLIYSISGVVTVIYVASLINPTALKLSQLYFLDIPTGRHYQVGNLWAFTLVMMASQMIDTINIKSMLVSIVGFVFIIISQARSAYLALLVGFFNLKDKNDIQNTHINKTSILILVFISVMFISSSINKSVIFSRPYFGQSIESFIKYPTGVGMGNFSKISLEYYNATKQSEKFSIYTHNIYLEALSGVGIFSIPFLIFIILSTLDVVKNKTSWSALYLAILVNFMFDTSYTIPGIIWIMFMTYGASQRENREKNEI